MGLLAWRKIERQSKRSRSMALGHKVSISLAPWLMASAEFAGTLR